MELDVEGVAEIVESSTDALDLLTNVDKEDDEFSHSVIGVGSFVAGSGFKFLTASAKKKVVTAVAAKLGSKVIPIVSWGSWAVTGYAALASGAGYDHTKITGSYEVWTYYKKQGGQWVQGYQYRNGKMKCKLVK